MAQINKSHNSFLGHLDDVHEMSETAKLARNDVRRRKPNSSKGDTKAFPENKIHELLWEGFKNTRKNYKLDLINRYNWRDIAITILMHGVDLGIVKYFIYGCRTSSLTQKTQILLWYESIIQAKESNLSRWQY